MTTTVFECGCSITYSMYGEREIVSVHICDQHQHDHPEILKVMADFIKEIHGIK